MIDLFKGLRAELESRVIPWWDRFVCNLDGERKQFAERYLLSHILFKLQELIAALNFGSNVFRITPYTLTSDPQRIVEREPNGRVRKVSIWLDPGSGGPTPIIRVGTSDTSANTGGIRVSAGTVAEMGEVHDKAELWAVCTNTSLNVYVIERA